jgi:hypothetical protein
MADRSYEPLEVTLQRLKKERLEADRLYQDALTALDKSLRSPPALPDIPLPLDEHQAASLNQSWDLQLSAPQRPVSADAWPASSGASSRHTGGSSRSTHSSSNTSCNAAATRASIARRRIAAAIQHHLVALHQFQMRLLAFVQQITLYVDTKDRDTAGGALVLNAALSGLSEEAGKRWESLATREQRYEARTAAIAGAQEELRAMVGVAQQASLALKREFEKIREPVARGAREPGGQAEAPEASATPVASAFRRKEAFVHELDAYKYVGFEDQFRGSQDASGRRAIFRTSRD